jgi:hypothetical protein
MYASRISGRHMTSDYHSVPVHRIDILTGKVSITSRKIAVYPDSKTVFYEQNKGDPI